MAGIGIVFHTTLLNIITANHLNPFGLVVRVQCIMCELGARHEFEPCYRQKPGISIENGRGPQDFSVIERKNKY